MARGYNQCEHRQMVESERVPGKGRIRASTQKVSGRVSAVGIICVRTKKWYNPGEYREKVESVRVRKNCPDDYGKTVQSV